MSLYVSSHLLASIGAPSYNVMKILLIRPPSFFSPGAIRPVVSLPVGLLSIAAVLDREGFYVKIYDAQVNITKPVSDENGTLLMGDNWQVVENKLREDLFDIVGISCGFSVQLPSAMKLAGLVRRIMPDSVIVMGGPPVSAMTGDILGTDSPVNIVCRGEGEYTLLELVRAIQSGDDVGAVAGTAVWNNGGINYAPLRPHIVNLDDLPFPAYHLVVLEHYFQLYEDGYTDRPVTFNDGYQRSVSVITSRGCPYNCVFCSIHLHMGKSWRCNSVRYVIDHISLLVNKYGVRHIHFEDDNITFSRSRFAGIVEGLGGFGITWDTPNGVRVDTLTEELVQQCKNNGCIYLVFGVESGNQHILNAVIDKRLDLASVIAAAAWCKKAELDAMAFFIIGFPGETRLDMEDTVNFAIRLYEDFDVTPHLFVATPLPGTRLEYQCLEAGLLGASLTPLELATMTQGNFRMGGGTFHAADITEVFERFFRAYRFCLIMKTMRFFLKRPVAFAELLRLMVKVKNGMSLKQKLIAAMLVKHSCLTGVR